MLSRAAIACLLQPAGHAQYSGQPLRADLATSAEALTPSLQQFSARARRPAPRAVLSRALC
jgi:hypothetical protein